MGATTTKPHGKIHVDGDRVDQLVAELRATYGGYDGRDWRDQALSAILRAWGEHEPDADVWEAMICLSHRGELDRFGAWEPIVRLINKFDYAVMEGPEVALPQVRDVTDALRDLNAAVERWQAEA